MRTGDLRWYKQLVPNDFHDWDLTQVSPLYEASIGGRERKLVATVGKDGLLRVLDRDNHGQLFEAEVATRSDVDALRRRALPFPHRRSDGRWRRQLRGRRPPVCRRHVRPSLTGVGARSREGRPPRRCSLYLWWISIVASAGSVSRWRSSDRSFDIAESSETF